MSVGLFIFDGIISLPIAAWGLWAIPDLPHTTRAFYWTDEVGRKRISLGAILIIEKQDKEYGVKRIEALGQKPPQRLNLKAIRKVYTNWRLWAFILPYT